MDLVRILGLKTPDGEPLTPPRPEELVARGVATIRVHQGLMKRADESPVPADISTSLLAILARAERPLTIIDLAEALDVSPYTVAPYVSRLCKAGQIETSASAQGGHVLAVRAPR